MKVRRSSLFRGIACLVLSLSAAGTDAQSWSRDWGQLASTPGFIADRIMPGGDGEFLIAGRGSFASFSTPLQRVRADGSTRWLSVLHGDNLWQVADAVVDADGSALVLREGIADSTVARVDATGALDWARRVKAKRMVALDAERVAVFGCVYPDTSLVTTLARIDGRVLDQRAIATGSAGCNVFGLDADGAGGVIVAQGFGDALPDSPMLALHIDADGATTWRANVASAHAMPAVRGANAYFTTPGRLQAVAVASGLPMWSVDCAAGTTLRFVGDDPLCALPDGRFVRLRAATGQAAWTSEPGLGDAVAVIDGDVYFARGTTLSRVHGVDGALTWSAATATVHAPHHVFMAGAGGDVVRVAMPKVFPGEPARIERYANADGAPLGTQAIERVVAGVAGYDARRDGDDVLALGTGDTYRLRSLSAGDGAVRWDVALDAQASISSPQYVISADAVAAVLSTENTTRVWHIDRTTGAVAWQIDLDAIPVVQRRVQYAPAFAVDGDVYVATSYLEGDAQAPTPRGFVYKLSAADGGVVWRSDISNVIDAGPAWSAPQIAAAGAGVVVGIGDGNDRGLAGPLRLADADGSVVWTSATTGLDTDADYTLAGDGALYGFGANAANDAVLTKIDAATGVLAWQRTYHEDGALFWPFNGEVVVLPGGDVVFGGVSSPDSGPWSDRLVRVAADGSSAERLWDGRSQVSSVRLIDDLDDEGFGWGQTLHGNLQVLRRFDFARRKFVAHRVLGPFESHEFDERERFSVSGPPLAGRVPASVSAVHAGAMPTSRVAMLDLADPVRGDLAVAMSRFAADTPFGADIPFTIGVRYIGDAPLDGVRVLARLPWSGTPSSLACAGQGATRCDVVERGDWIDVRMDLAPGADVEIVGAIRALWFAPWWGEPMPPAEAVVFGPVSFEETNIDNNLSNGDALFLGDFD
ncbi:MAG TPA: PQQ-binding-like beta-propeller repeat protein [Tahibacter sp.]|nr:PQQ-binding-like beta-propeller repeat protein [Tahibacter sp.]